MQSKQWVSLCVLVCSLGLTLGCNEPSRGKIEEPVQSINPCDDFYQYACGEWIAKNEIPADRSAWGTFNQLNEQNTQAVKNIIDEITAPTYQAKDPDVKKIADYYRSCMNESVLEAVGRPVIAERLDAIEKMTDLNQLPEVLARLHMEGFSSFFSFGAGPDSFNASKMIAGVAQSGLGLPDRDYYLNTDARSAKLRVKYQEYIQALFALWNVAGRDSSAEAAGVLSFETQLAQVNMPIVDQRDPYKVYHPSSAAQLQEMTPHFSWENYFKATGIPTPEVIDVAMLDYMKGLDLILGSSSLDSIKSYLRARVLTAAADSLGGAHAEEAFKFEQNLSGVLVKPVRWKICAKEASETMKDILGRLYVERTFSEESKAEIQKMVDLIKKAFENNLDALTWMDDVTKAKAREKLNHVDSSKIGYPSEWKTYEGIEISEHTYLENGFRIGVHSRKENLARIGKSSEDKEIHMPASLVNAYYNPLLNEIVFPAGILQPPFYDPKTLSAINYGAIGWVVGHELTHGFDDQGGQYDAYGSLKDWWTPSVKEEFQNRANCVVKQYDAYVPIDDLHVNGSLTQGENIADLGGVKLAFAAYKNLKKIQKCETRGGAASLCAPTNWEDQQFFRGAAQVWCQKMRPDALRQLIRTNPHSPAQYRVNGVMSNMPAFAEAFGCKAGDKMVSANRCEVW